MFLKCVALSFLNIGHFSDSLSADTCAPWTCSHDQRENKQNKLQITLKKNLIPNGSISLRFLSSDGSFALQVIESSEELIIQMLL